jgi:chromosome segregation ATPase
VAGEKPPVSAAPEPQPQPAASAAPQPTPDRTAEIDQLRDENRQLMQALDLTLANQQDLANQLRKTNEALAQIRSDVALVRERLRDLELAQESHPLSQQHAAGVAQQP